MYLKSRQLKLPDIQAGNAPEIPDIRRANRIAQFEGGHADEKVCQRYSNSFRLGLPVNLTSTQGYRNSNRVSRDSTHKLIDKALAPISAFYCVGPSNCVR